MTALSPRLRHLLIQEDRQTGRLIHPDPRVRGHSPEERDRFPSPVLLGKAPTHAHELPPILPLRSPPRPTTSDYSRRPSNLFNLLNELHVQSPPSSAGSISPKNSARRAASPTFRRPSSPPRIAPPSQTHSHSHGNSHSHAHPRPHPQMHAFDAYAPGPLSAPITAQPYFSTAHRGSEAHVPPPRPDLFRRHSAHPYEINPVTNRIVYKEFDFSPVGSRAPISRTTKACNACRARKVRCDAGGGSQGAEPSMCSRCRESGVDCVYSGVQKKRGPCPGTTRPTLAQRRRGSQKGDLMANVPETAPPALSTKGSIQSTAIATPPDGSPPYSSRSSYGFPAPIAVVPHAQIPGPLLSPYGPAYPPAPHSSHNDWSTAQPRAIGKGDVRRPSTQPAGANHAPHHGHWQPAPPPPPPQHRQAPPPPSHDARMFRQDYTMRPPTGDAARFAGGRNLPPLSVAIERRASYYDPGR